MERNTLLISNSAAMLERDHTPEQIGAKLLSSLEDCRFSSMEERHFSAGLSHQRHSGFSPPDGRHEIKGVSL
jgi:hypothetical protein